MLRAILRANFLNFAANRLMFKTFYKRVQRKSLGGKPNGALGQTVSS
jgi:hypothetical protein